MIAARRQAHRRRRIGQQLAPRLVGGGDRVEQFAVGLGVGARAVAVEPRALRRTGPGHSPRDDRAALGGGWQRQVGGTDSRDFDMEVDPVEQGAGHSRLIVGGAARGAGAGLPRIAQVTAAARVHRGDQLDAGRKGQVRIGPRHGDRAGLERLAQAVEHRALEFGQLVEEQHAQMGEADLPRPDLEAAANQRGHRRTVVGRAERAAALDLPAVHLARDRGDH